MAIRNVYKEDVELIELPSVAEREDRGAELCNEPFLVLADTDDAQYYKNDRTGVAFKVDSLTVELEDEDGNVTSAPGTAVSFPYQSDALGYVVDWRQVVSGGSLAVGCYKLKISYTKSGISDYFYWGSYQLLPYSTFNAEGTVRLFVVLNDLVRKEGINYRESGFATTIRFKGQFGFMQPNYDTENIIYTDRTRKKVRNEALRTYELHSDCLLSCFTEKIDEAHLLAANQIYVSDHNAYNHKQYLDFPVILSEDESPSYEYPIGAYAKINAYFKDKVAVHESKYDGDIEATDNVIFDLPTVVTTPAECDTPIGAKVLKTNQTISYRTGDDADLQEGRETDFFTLSDNNPFGNTNRFTDELGTQVYTNDIVLDWSTYDGNEVLGLYRILQTPANWNNCIDNALSFSVGSFSSGWFLPNYKQLQYITNVSLGSGMLNYSPINITSSVLNSSTTYNANTNNNLRLGVSVATNNLVAKTTTQSWIPMRNFTNAELGI